MACGWSSTRVSGPDMRLARVEQIQEIDRLATSRFGLPARDLMDCAGARMAEFIRDDESWPRDRDVWVLCGPGKNGGDGQVLARHLRSWGFRVRVWPRETWAESPALPVLSASDFARAELPSSQELASAALIVDALFGVGLNRPLDGFFRDLVSRVNASGRPVIAVDVPSGLDADRGIAWGDRVRATRTLTCGLAKPGFFLQDGPASCGRVHVLKIGFPLELERTVAADTFLIGRASARRLWPRPPSPTANKTKFGRVLVIGGCPGMEGAVVLSATAAARAGAGYVTLCTPGIVPFGPRPPDFLTLKWSEWSTADLTRYQAIIVGPGLGEGGDRADLLRKVVSSGVKTVVDAEALTVLAAHPDLRLHGNCVITPHAGELSRLIPAAAGDIERDRLKAVREASLARGSIALLKGFHTIVDDGAKSWIINSGNVALAKAGAGDVLAGFIAGFAAQGLGLAEASVLGAFLHGDIADRWVRAARGSRTLMASDLPRLLSSALRALRA